jgi:hypothetical protein
VISTEGNKFKPGEMEKESVGIAWAIREAESVSGMWWVGNTHLRGGGFLRVRDVVCFCKKSG